jgi:Flp pilus assembly protein TadD
MSDSAERTSLLERLQRIAPTQPRVAAARARMAIDQRDFSTGIGIYEDLRRRYPDEGDYVLGLAQALDDAGRSSQARSELQAWLADHPRDLAARMLLAQQALRQDATALAIDQYRSVLDLVPEQPVALNNLAMLIAEDQPEEALALAERGLALRPDDPAFMDTVGLVLLQLGQAERARELLAKAHLATPDPSIAYRYAKALAATGDPAQARRVLLQNATRSYPEKAEADALLRSLQE